MSAAGASNDNLDNNDNDNNSNNIIFIIKDTKLYVPVVALLARDGKKLSRLLKRFERSVYWNESKIKSDSENITNKFRYFLEPGFVGVNRSIVLVYSNQNANAKRFNARKYCLRKEIIKNYVIINGKNVQDQPVDSAIKLYEKIRKLKLKIKTNVKIILLDVY